MKLEVVVIPVSTWSAKRFYGDLVGGSTPSSPRATVSDHTVYASRVAVLGHLRPGSHVGRAGLGTELASALRRAAAAHGEHEKRTGQHDADWPDWYAEYIVREQAGKELPS